MRKQGTYNKIISKLLNPILVYNYLLIYSLYIVYSINANNSNILINNIKLVFIFFIISYILPSFTLFSIRKFNKEELSKEIISSNAKKFDTSYYSVYLIFFLIYYMFFSILNLPDWLKIIILSPILSIVFLFLLRNVLKASFTSLVMGNAFLYVYYLIIYMNGYLSIFPILFVFLFSGIALSNEINTGNFSLKDIGLSYFIGLLSCVFIILFKLAF